MTIIGEYVPNFKPCPFCGSKPYFNGHVSEENSNGADYHFIKISCESCDINMTVSHEPPMHPRYVNPTAWSKTSEADKNIARENHENACAAERIKDTIRLEADWNRRAT